MLWSGVVTLVLLAAGRHGSAEPLGCRDQDGTAVDWYVLYKLPKMDRSDVQHVSDGLGYVHYSSASSGGRWTMSDVPISNDLSAPGRTLTPVYDNSQRESLIYVLYNDQYGRGSEASGNGHTKGVVAFDGDVGFWMVHSVPFFPPPPSERYDYFENGKRYGQSFLCLTLNLNLTMNATWVEDVAQQLLFNEPNIYSSQMSPRLREQYPMMAKVMAGERRSNPPWFSVMPMQIPGGDQFTSYAKAGAYADDLYSRLVARDLQTALFTETWLRMGKLPSYCLPPYEVYNVQNVSVTATHAPPASGEVTFVFRYTKDHSKWAVSKNELRPWVCVGDINRMEAQRSRGGGTVCHNSPALWRVYRQMVLEFEPCP